ncbi:hypothetical protein B0H17DRAFT_1209296 [Mycena rosella]|uniref:Uncharacterized protein n=1 Tax=Mycena rosella TaxID=1033263 RepID=A0AAD7CZ74_MYCRO|nr:hypothetical protein B0H17DRAFT_1209296 [Mycena rosella]
MYLPPFLAIILAYVAQASPLAGPPNTDLDTGTVQSQEPPTRPIFCCVPTSDGGCKFFPCKASDAADVSASPAPAAATVDEAAPSPEYYCCRFNSFGQCTYFCLGPPPKLET